MCKLKQIPEDFIVNEISEVKPSHNGNYSYFILEKRNYTTVGALEFLSKRFNIPLKFFGFAGNKDKNAITTQKISIFRGSRNFENAELRDLKLSYLGNGNDPTSLGDLDGNEFIITVRNLADKEVLTIKNISNKKIVIPNLFGSQRFSKNNSDVGKSIVKKDFKKAVALLLENSGQIEDQVRNHLDKNKNDFISAIRLIPLKTRKLLVHSYQSFLFNKVAAELINLGIKDNIDIPMIGFDFDLNSMDDETVRLVYKKIIREENISERDFVINSMPELTEEGTTRSLFVELKNFEIIEDGNDDLNADMKKCKVKFFLSKGSYATVAIDFILKI